MASTHDPKSGDTRTAQGAQAMAAGARATLPLRIAGAIAVNRIAWLLTVCAAMVLAFAGLMLSLGWQIGPQVVARHAEYAKLTGRAQARVVESWLALDLDLRSIKHADYWRASAQVSPCVVVDLEGDWGSNRRRAFCGNRFGFNDAYDVPFLDHMAPGVPFAWPRDERGFATPEIRLSKTALDYLDQHSVDTFMHRKWPARNALEWLKLEVGRPVDLAIAGWRSTPALLPVAYDPASPTAMYPQGIIDTRMAARPAWILGAVLCVIGGALWWTGMGLLPVVQNFNRPGRIVFSVLPLLALPWFADYLPAGIAALSPQVASVVKDMLGDVDPLDRFVATAPADASLAHGERVKWRAGDEPYAQTFGRLRFTLPASPPDGGDSALAALALQAGAQIRALDPAQRAALFDRVRRDKAELELVDAGLVFVPAARETLLDANADPALRRAAARLLSEWVTSPVLTADPHRPAYAQRDIIWRSLADVPVPEIASRVH